MQKIDYADEATQKIKLGSLLSGAGFKFVQDLVDAKESGKKLPKTLDKIATLALKGKNTGYALAEQTVKEKAKAQIPWIVAGALGLTILVMMYKRK